MTICDFLSYLAKDALKYSSLTELVHYYQEETALSYLHSTLFRNYFLCKFRYFEIVVGAIMIVLQEMRLGLYSEYPMHKYYVSRREALLTMSKLMLCA